MPPSLSRRHFLAVSAASSATASLRAQNAPAPRGSSATPNLVFLISDDHSVPDLGCYGNPHVRTPNLDRLAAEGMRFQNGFVASPQCSPNRSSIFTGSTPHTINTTRLHTPMPPWEPTLIQHLKERGYFTGVFRKHHQGDGFQRKLDFYGDNNAPFSAFTDALPPGKPFFLQFGSTDPHRPYADGAVTPPHHPTKVTVPPFLPDTPAVRKDLAHYYDEISRFDTECGELLQLLRSRGLLENTLVIVTGDNGMPFPRAKGTLYDPGIRVPLLAWWPGKIRAGQVSQQLISHLDLTPTWLDCAGAPPIAKAQGSSFLPLLTGQPYTPREYVFSERNWHDNYDPQRSVRSSRYKLIFNAMPERGYRPSWDLEDSPSWTSIKQMERRGGLTMAQQQMVEPSRAALEFYDLETDPNEFQNLIGSQDPAIQREIDRHRVALSNWMHETYDYLPPLLRNPVQDPAKARFVPPAL